jgi:hypothetical protein
VRFGDREGARLAVNGAAGGGVDDLADAVLDGEGADAGGTAAVDFEVVDGVGLADLDARLCGVVVDDLRAKVGDDPLELAGMDVDFVQAGGAVDVAAAAGGEVVDDGDLMAGFEVSTMWEPMKPAPPVTRMCAPGNMLAKRPRGRR